ncbi:MAG: hypothetical protein L0387_29665, partial [Acidobacteria bacterium]|nr:hypothetical protein [Acidobacteriota bacterium]
MKKRIAFLHASPAAVPPLAEFCANEAPDLEVTNLLDDSLLRFFRSGDLDSAEARLKDMLSVARDIHGAELAMLTCSAVPKDRMENLRRNAGITLLKIDAPMAEAAVRAASRIGVAVTFPRTLDTAIQLLAEAAEDARVRIELFPLVAP